MDYNPKTIDLKNMNNVLHPDYKQTYIPAFQKAVPFPKETFLWWTIVFHPPEVASSVLAHNSRLLFLDVIFGYTPSRYKKTSLLSRFHPENWDRISSSDKLHS